MAKKKTMFVPVELSGAEIDAVLSLLETVAVRGSGSMARVAELVGKLESAEATLEEAERCCSPSRAAAIRESRKECPAHLAHLFVAPKPR